MRLRTTAPPSARFTLVPNREGAPFSARGSKKTTKCRPDCRRPPRYTASNSARRSKRHSRGKAKRSAFRPPDSDAREFVATLPATGRQYFAAALGLHACAEAMRLVTPADLRLKRSLGQSRLPGAKWRAQPAIPRAIEFTSLDEASASVNRTGRDSLCRFCLCPKCGKNWVTCAKRPGRWCGWPRRS